jgi:hypothetical protein
MLLTMNRSTGDEFPNAYLTNWIDNVESLNCHMRVSVLQEKMPNFCTNQKIKFLDIKERDVTYIS